jgi:hypothetical protein
MNEEKNHLESVEQKEFKVSTKSQVCPTCGRKAKFTKKKLIGVHCLTLLHIYKWYRHAEHQPDILDYFKYEELFKSFDFEKYLPELLYWDLVERKGKMISVGKRKPKEKLVFEKGLYRISENGVKFCQREIAIPITALLFNRKVEAHKLFPYKTIDEILNEELIGLLKGEEDKVLYDWLIKPETNIDNFYYL